MGLVISEGLRLKSYNTPAAIAGVAPTLDYRFALDRREIEAISLTDKLTYTGATNGTFVNRSGLIERATTDLPRFDHNPDSRQSLGLLMEEERANLLLRSEEFENASWTKIDIGAVTGNSIAAPSSALTADKLYANASVDGVALLRRAVSFANEDYALTLYAKAAEYDFLMLRVNDPNNHRAVFNLATGQLGNQSLPAGSTASMAPVGNGWYRCVLITTTLGTGTYNTEIWCRPTNSFSTGVYSNTAENGIYIWGAQLEAGAFPTSYIPTTTTALTRPVDSAVIDGTGVITGTYTLVEKPAGCAVVNGSNIDLVNGFTAERVMVFPAALSAPQITAIRGAM